MSDDVDIYSDELPERLTLPDVLSSASSLQNLVSLSLLGKSKIITTQMYVSRIDGVRFLELPDGEIWSSVRLPGRESSS